LQKKPVMLSQCVASNGAYFQSGLFIFYFSVVLLSADVVIITH